MNHDINFVGLTASFIINEKSNVTICNVFILSIVKILVQRLLELKYHSCDFFG